MADHKAVVERTEVVEAKTNFEYGQMSRTEEEEAIVRRKLDWQIVSMVTVLYLMWDSLLVLWLVL